MDDGAKVNKSLKLCTNSFTYNECLILIKVLNDNFNIKASIQLAGSKNKFIINI
jgi:LAGLIDADG DNA endonuclease family